MLKADDFTMLRKYNLIKTQLVIVSMTVIGTRFRYSSREGLTECSDILKIAFETYISFVISIS